MPLQRRRTPALPMEALKGCDQSPYRPTLANVISLLLPALPLDCGHRSPPAPTLLSPPHPVCDSLQEVSCEGQGLIFQAEQWRRGGRLCCGPAGQLTTLCFQVECLGWSELSGRVAEERPGLEGFQPLHISAPHPKVWLITVSHERGHKDVVRCLELDTIPIHSQYM